MLWQNYRAIVARFKYYKFGVLVPTQCPHRRYGAGCGREDGSAHLLNRYSLEEKIQDEIETIGFPVDMAVKTVPSNP